MRCWIPLDLEAFTAISQEVDDVVARHRVREKWSLDSAGRGLKQDLQQKSKAAEHWFSPGGGVAEIVPCDISNWNLVAVTTTTPATCHDFT